MLFCIVIANAVTYLHDFVSNQVSDSPALVNRKLLNVRQEVLIDLLLRQHFGEVDNAVN